ncbi:hypothetical protein [Neptunicella marina]|uniref:Metallo-beta-lactamase domain-containing protein n=1 Tax=Neptunicella marina TaxID=2125989 RepID=A0A8J6M1I3_9ALTE|nr:hypothetical protein [Neptunicella marina]MBC3765503.1 hypothetical protein [Neptunicella marina]
MLKIPVNLCLLLFCFNCAAADKSELDLFIDKVVAQYGGDKLHNAQSLELVEHYNGFRMGQSYSFDRIDKVNYSAQTTILLPTQQVDFRWIRSAGADFSIQHQQFDGELGYQVDHKKQQVSQGGISLGNVDRNHLINLDAYLVWLLDRNRSNATDEGELRSPDGQLHKITFKAGNYPEMTLFIQSKSGTVLKMQRKHWLPNTYFVHEFSQHKRDKGVLYAASSYITRGGQPFSASSSRRLTINNQQTKNLTFPAFAILPSTKESGTSNAVDSATFISRKVADNLYQAGSGWGYSLFYDAGDYFVGIGGYKDLTKRFNAIQTLTKKSNPLKYQIFTHHHADHLGGVNEAVTLGAQLVTAQELIPAIRDAAATPIADNQFVLVDGVLHLADNKISVFPFNSDHAKMHLVAHFTPGNTLFSEDVYYSRQQQGSPQGYADLVRLNSAMQNAGVRVQHYAAAHSPRVLDQQDFEYSLANMAPESDKHCPETWSICQSYSF